jgi:sugar phosphate permease
MADTQIKQSRNPWNFGVKGWGIAFTGIFCWIFWQGPLYAGSNFFFTFLGPVETGGIGEMGGHTFGWSTPSMAAALTIGGVLAVVSTAFFGGAIKKLGTKKLIFICMILCAIVDLFFAFSQTLISYQVSAAVYFMICMGFSAIGVGQLGADWFPRKRGVYMGVATIGMTINTAFTPLLLSLAVPKFGITNTILFHSLLEVVVGIVILVAIKNNPEEAGAYPDNDKTFSKEEILKEFNEMEEYRKTSSWTTAKLLKTKEIWVIGIGWGLSMMVIIGTVQQLVTILVSFGFALEFGVWLLAATWPIGIFGHALTGLNDFKIGPRWTTATALLCAIAGSIVLNLIAESCAATGQTAPVIAAGALFLIGATMVTVECPSMVTGAFGRADFLNAWPVISVIYQLLQNVGVLLIAILATVWGYHTGLWIIGVIMVVAIIIVLAAPKKQIEGTRVVGGPARASH